MDLNLKGKVAIVTGGGSGIGKGIALAFARELAYPVIADIDEKKASQVEEEINTEYSGTNCFASRTDVTCEKSVHSLVKQVVDRFGTIHILVNNVGVTIPNLIQDVTEEDMRRTVDVNIKGAVYCARMVYPYMKRQHWGRIISLTSMSGFIGSAGLSVYSMSKFALRGLTHALGRELGEFQITVNAVAPTDIYETGSWRENPSLYEISMKKEGVSSPEELRRKRIERIPVKRSCTVEDVADLVVFLSSEKAGFINCQTILLNGGSVPT